jgi:2-polyprenyl-3-methyl-5-hydroxy-6-metoxy-1,4-benzoquinol methylase
MSFRKLPTMLRVIGRPIVRLLKQWKFRLLPYRPDPSTPADFEVQYAGGQWDYLKGLSELVHYSVIIGYCQHLKPAGALLDLACGEGILQERLDATKYTRYVGVDASAGAIGRALPRQNAKTSFVTADVQTYVPDGRFDVIIFNECLYYFKDPLATVRRYEPFLTKGGLFIISICDHGSTLPIWKMLETLYFPLDAVQVCHQSHLSWTIKVLAPASRYN